MTKFDINTDLLKNTLGLSCVENLLTYILRANNISLYPLYANSFLTYSEVENALTTQQETYATFSSLARIQHIAEKEGIIKIKLIDSPELPLTCDDHYLIVMVAPDFAKDKYKKVLWRDDHYILVSQSTENTLNYINDNPLDTGKMSFGELQHYYAGHAIAISIENTCYFNSIEHYVETFLHSCKIDVSNKELNSYDVMMLRDIVGILKILRRRAYALVSFVYDVDYMIDYFKLLDHKYTVLEYMRIRKQYDPVKLKQIRDEIIAEDTTLINKLLLDTRSLTEIVLQ